MFASFCIRAITSLDSTIILLGATPAALDANPKDSLIALLAGLFKADSSDSNTTLASLTLVALSNDAITFNFYFLQLDN